ncbi:MAG: 50S ribosomal protein L4 [Planctomycetota bacterium]|jgi:large subunit ribosomal protein L4|nr:50S ribosomal protein L4 [Planctomycetota bacterium]
MTAIPVYDASGAKTRDIEIDPTVLDKAVRKALLKESLIAYLASQRQGTHKVKRRSEVQGGSAKPWRQKGTGRARQGTIRAPHFVGGGRAHGPAPRDYSYRLPRKQRRQAVRSALRFRLDEGKFSAVEGLAGADKPQTKAVAGFLKGAGLEGRGVLFVSEGMDRNLYLSARNIQKVEVAQRDALNAGQILQRANLVFTAEALDALVKEVAQ